MKNTKEEIMKETAINQKIAETNIINETAEIIYKTLNRGQEQNSTSIINAIEQRINDCFISQTSHLTDQIKSMENYISDVDGQVKELREEKERLKITATNLKENLDIAVNNETYYRDRVNEQHGEHLKIHNEQRSNRLKLDAEIKSLIEKLKSQIDINSSLQSQLESLQKENEKYKNAMNKIKEYFKRQRLGRLSKTYK